MVWLAWGLLSAFFTSVFGLVFIVWVFREHTHARRYRHLVELAAAIPKEAEASGGWKVTYKEGRQTKEAILQGATESEAMASLVKQGIRYDAIVTLERRS